MFKKLAIFTLILFSFNSIAFANNSDLDNPQSYTRTLLPEVNKNIIKSNADCRVIITNFESIYFGDSLNATPAAPAAPASATTPAPPIELGTIERFSASLTELNRVLKAQATIAGIQLGDQELTRNDVLGCSLVTGRISFMYLSIFFSYALNMLAIIAGSISMLFIIFGGYQYVIGSLTQNTDDAKKTITNAIIGLLLSTGAWIIVNIVLAIASS